MRRFLGLAWLGLLLVPVLAGCKSGATAPWGQKTASQNPSPQPYEAQFADLNSRARKLDADNNELQATLAQSQKQSQIAKDQVALLQRRLEETAGQLKEMQVAKQEAEKRVESLQASVQQRGGAIITANSSVRQSLAAVSVPGLDIRQDGDVIRIDIPADQLFHPGTNQLQPTASQILDQVADAIARNYAKQRIGIEGHTDGAPTLGGFAYTDHQLSTAQALAVFDQITQRNRLSPTQFLTVGHGTNHPRYSNAALGGRERNRRIEFVIYPDSIERK